MVDCKHERRRRGGEAVSRKKVNWEQRLTMIHKNQVALMQEYSGCTICIPADNRWDYAIPEMYRNFLNGFLFPRYEEYRGMPLLDHPQFGRLYLRWNAPCYALEDGQDEKYLCFNRKGEKFTVIITKCPKREGGNPSYFRFLPRVEEYTPRRKRKETE